MTNDSKLFIPREKADEAGYKPDEYGRWIGPEGDVLSAPLRGADDRPVRFQQEGLGQRQGPHGRVARHPWEKKVIEPQFLMRQR
jgi:hypothetical protein